ncbi:MAG: thioredoxin [Candidatus Binatota bacterium]
MATITQVGDDNFEAEVLRSGLPVLIDFWAPWCGPCKSIAPIIEELAREYEGRLKVAKLNVDENPGTPSRYGVRGIPNLIILKGGAVKEQLVGVVPKSRLVDAIERALAA